MIIPKRGKPSNGAPSYRPIFSLSAVGKLLKLILGSTDRPVRSSVNAIILPEISPKKSEEVTMPECIAQSLSLM